MSKIAGKVRGAEDLAPEAWLSVFKKRGEKLFASYSCPDLIGQSLGCF